MLKRAQEKGLLNLNLVDLREFGQGKHRTLDDRPYGGGPGMVLMAEPVCSAIRSRRKEKSHVVHLSPQGAPLTSVKAEELAKNPHLVLLCGYYEGIDQRAIDLEVDEEVSVGDFVLTNGSLAALVLLDAVIRFVPGVLHDEAASHDSFALGHFDCPHYTRPQSFEGIEVPQVLLDGNHQKIHEWRMEQGRKKTEKVRPDLLKH